MLVTMCAKYEKNPSRIVCAVEQTQQDVSWMNDLDEIGHSMYCRFDMTRCDIF